MNTIIVAEIGCNHNGNIDLALELIDKAYAAGVTAVKFQMFNPRDLVSIYAEKAEYQKKNTSSDEKQIEMLKKLELTPKEYLKVKKYAEKLGISVFATAFDLKSAKFLKDIGQNIWKIPSGEITNLPLLEYIRDIKCKDKCIILSTGMSTIDDIEYATNILEKSEDTRLILLHCNTDYPTQDVDMNIRSMLELKRLFTRWEVGLSDHSEGTVGAILAVGLGAVFIEKHFTLDKTMEGPDHRASITPDELNELCESIQRAELMLGSESKKVTASEKKNKYIARKSIVASKKITKGECFTEDNITCKRPGNGISPKEWYNILGKVAEADFEYDQMIRCKGFSWEDENE